METLRPIGDNIVLEYYTRVICFFGNMCGDDDDAVLWHC